MLQYVNSVLVGKAQSTTAKTMATAVAGDVLMFNELGAVISTPAEAAAAKAIKLGLVTSKTQDYVKADGTTSAIKVLQYSNIIPKNSIRTVNQFSFVPAAEDKISIKFNTFAPVVGNRYVLRIIYKDLYEHPGQFTHTYEVIASSTDIDVLIGKFMLQINKDTRRRVVATLGADNELVLTALPKSDNEGKESINIYTQVNMLAVMYYTNPNATGFASKNKYPLEGVEVNKVTGTPGKGNAKLIRDREQAALSYKGITNRTWFPVVKPELNVDLSKQYDGVVIEFEPEHRTAEDGFRKTKQSVELYVENGTAIAASMIGKLVKSFADGIAVA